MYAGFRKDHVRPEVKKFWFWVKILEIVPAVLPVFVVNAKGLNVVPLKRAAEEVPKPGMMMDPVSISAWLESMSDVLSCLDVKVYICRLRSTDPAARLTGDDSQTAPLYFMR